MMCPAETFSNKNLKRPVIVAFLNSPRVVWTSGPRLPGLVMKSIIRRRSSFKMSPKRKQSSATDSLLTKADPLANSVKFYSSYF